MRPYSVSLGSAGMQKLLSISFTNNAQYYHADYHISMLHSREYHYFLDMQERKDRIMVNEIRQYNWKKAVDKRRKMDEFIS